MIGSPLIALPKIAGRLAGAPALSGERTMHFKRKRPKNGRAGCLLCKPHKGNGMCPRHKNMRHGNRRRWLASEDQIRCLPVSNLRLN